MSFLKKFADSSKELSDIRSVAVCAMMLALRIVLGIFANFSLSFLPLPVVKISLAFIPVMLTGYLYGPVCSSVVACAGDVFSYLLAPTALGFNPAITACYLLEGIIYGVCLYKSELMLPNVILAKVLDLVLCTVTLNALVLQLMFFNTTPLYYIIFLRAIILVPIGVIEVVLIVSLKEPLLKIQTQLHKR